MNPRIEARLIARRTVATNRAAIDSERAMNIPSYRAQELKVRSLGYEIAMSGKTDAQQEKELVDAIQLRDDIAQKHGLCPSPLYSCTKCNDTGLVHGRLCDCARKLLTDDLRERMHLAATTVIDFDTTDFSCYGADAENVKKIYAQMQAFCTRFDTTKKQVVILTGAVGTGKTHLASCVLHALETTDKSTLFLTAFEFGNICFAQHTSFDRSDHLDAVLDADFLVLDDLGTEPIYRNVTLEYLYSVLSDRLLRGKKTMITTNLSLDLLLARYGERIFSRLNNKALSVTFEMNGADLRLKKN